MLLVVGDTLGAAMVICLITCDLNLVRGFSLSP